MHIKVIKMRWASGGVNYSYLLSSLKNGKSWLIDPAEELEVLAALTDAEKKSVQVIANTHHHPDHSAGNIPMVTALKALTPGATIEVIGGSKDCPGVTDIPKDQREYTLDSLKIKCIRTPCHTQDSICYYVKDIDTDEQCIFTGDTLFTAGCGRFFEGTGEEMDKALNKTILEGVGMKNVEQTRVYQGHEYTKSNIAFAATIFSTPQSNEALVKLNTFANNNEVTTGHFTLGDELRFNPFMRLEDPIVLKAVGDKDGKWPRSKVMDALRKMKNDM